MARLDSMSRSTFLSLLAGYLVVAAPPPLVAWAEVPGSSRVVVREDGNFQKVVRSILELNANQGQVEDVQYIELWRKWSERSESYQQTGVETVNRVKLVPVLAETEVQVPDWETRSEWFPRTERITEQGTRSIQVPVSVARSRWVSLDEARDLGAAGLPHPIGEPVKESIQWRWAARSETVDSPRFKWIPGYWAENFEDTLVLPDLTWASQSVPVWHLGYWSRENIVEERQVAFLATESVQVNPTVPHELDDPDRARVLQLDEKQGRALIEEQVPVTDSLEETGFENRLVPQVVIRSDGTYAMEDRMMPVASTRSIQVPRVTVREIPVTRAVDLQVWDQVRVSVPVSRTEVVRREAGMATESYQVNLPKFDWVPNGDWMSHESRVRTDRRIVRSVALPGSEALKGTSSDIRASAFGSDKANGEGLTQLSGTAGRDVIGASKAAISSSHKQIQAQSRNLSGKSNKKNSDKKNDDKKNHKKKNHDKKNDL